MSVIVSDAKCVQYEMEIAIAAPREKTWQALIQDIARWWLANFHMVQADSEVVFDTVVNKSACS